MTLFAFGIGLAGVVALLGCPSNPPRGAQLDGMASDGLANGDAGMDVDEPTALGQLCGLDEDGVYGRICTHRVDGGFQGSFIYSTYCNEGLGRCQALRARCEAGWCYVPAGSYVAGWSPDVSAIRSRLMAQPHITVQTRPFWIRAAEITQGEWLDVMAPTENPSPWPLRNCGLDCPVSNVTFFDAVRFANHLSERDGLPTCYDLSGCDAPTEGYGYECTRVEFAGPDCLGYRLPSEGEWELAARAGSPYCYPNGPATTPNGGDIAHPDPVLCPTDEIINEIDWFCGNCQVDYPGCPNLVEEIGTGVTCAGIHPVGEKRPNRLGIFDTGGNVMEWAGDVFRYYDDASFYLAVFVDPGYDTVITYDPASPRNKDIGVLRGGSFGGTWNNACSANRSPVTLGREKTNGDDPPFGFWGLRLVRTATAEESAAIPEPL